jgi:hypothetical protein
LVEKGEVKEKNAAAVYSLRHTLLENGNADR